MRIFQKLSWKRSAAIFGGILFFIWTIFIQPIWNLNVERWAEKRALDKTLNENIQDTAGFIIPEWIIAIVDYATGPFGIGFVTGSLIFAFWDVAAKRFGTFAPLGSSKSNTIKRIEIARTMIKIDETTKGFNKLELDSYLEKLRSRFHKEIESKDIAFDKLMDKLETSISAETEANNLIEKMKDKTALQMSTSIMQLSIYTMQKQIDLDNITDHILSGVHE